MDPTEWQLKLKISNRFLGHLLAYDLFYVLGRTLGISRSEDGVGNKNVAEKLNSRSFNLRRDYSKLLTLSNVGEPS